ncbi:ABC transporter permease [Mesorhizobium erdmanii]|uniref:ABC transporter permease n=1 Tax=Mesorhizobium erdmanii TaxID=1777866 RepID=A0A6M7UEW7_9HYPH|nr:MULTISPECIES: ABC transporter permease [Mesorhizobium]OBQ59303.1 sugar ABC transporter permease [Mesorhizobium loti]QKC75775.1 ABC transporter permease [Mesorhizobium erdmanii]
MDFVNAIVQVLDSTIRLSVPLLLACLAGLFSERSGIFDIGLEGKMLVGAFAGAAAASVFHSAFIGLGMAILISVAFAMVHGFASITHRGNQIVSGVAINFIAAGSTIILGQAWFQQGGRTPALQPGERFESITADVISNFLSTYSFSTASFADFLASIRGLILYLPALLIDALARIPGFGPIFAELVLGHSILVYFAFAMVPFTWWVLFRTRFGLRLRAVGENPAAVDTAGISVAWLRYRALICTGILTGVAGAYLSMVQNGGFVKDMTAGKGYIALAALIFAKWKPVNAMFACLLFGFLDAASIRLQGSPLPIVGKVSAQFMQALPYVLTVVLLAGFIGKAIPPRAGGVPYVKER